MVPEAARCCTPVEADRYKGRTFRDGTRLLAAGIKYCVPEIATETNALSPEFGNSGPGRTFTRHISRRGQAGKESRANFPAVIAGGRDGFVLCQAGGQCPGRFPHALSCPKASNKPRY